MSTEHILWIITSYTFTLFIGCVIGLTDDSPLVDGGGKVVAFFSFITTAVCFIAAITLYLTSQ